ncbi:MAG: type I-G CRISPR-associated protein, Cas3-extension family [Phycisphaerales bacterium]
MTEPLQLNGLDGANPLGFLAALGTLALCDRLQLHPRISWRPYANSYRPLLWVDDSAELSNRLCDCIQHDLTGDPPAWCAGTVIKRPSEDYRRFASTAAQHATLSNRHEADFAAAYASDAACDEKTYEVLPTRFSFSNGQGGKILLRDYRDLADTLTKIHIDQALYQPWQSADPCKTFRWEPRDLRLYALRAENPGSCDVFSTHGANVLAFWAMTMLPGFPLAPHALGNAAFARLPDGLRKADFFSWPIWDAPLTRDVVAALLLRSNWQQEKIDHHDVAQLAIHAVFRAKRVNYQKSLYFSSSVVA